MSDRANDSRYGQSPVDVTQATNARVRRRDVLLIATFCALVSAAWYAGQAGVRAVILGAVVNVSRDVVWMSAAAYLVFFLGAAFFLVSVARWLPGAVVLRLATATFIGAALLGILLPFSQVWPLASAILSLGVGVALASVVVRRPATWLRRFERGTAALALVLAVAAVSIGALTAFASRRHIPNAAVDGAPNVLLIVLDAVRASTLSTYGNPRATTPHLDRLGREGVVFELPIATAPWTLPSHVTMFTGEYQFADGTSSSFLRRPASDSGRVLALSFREAGYQTAAFVANLFYTAWDSGLGRGFSVHLDYPRTFEQVLRTSSFGQTNIMRRLYEAKSMNEALGALASNDFSLAPRPRNATKRATEVTDEFLAWHAQKKQGPFFVFMNYIDAHAPYDPPAPFDTLFVAESRDRALYDGTVSYMDAEVGRLLDHLRTRGVLDSTLVVVTSDHGELFGEHGLWEHTSNLYFRVLHVPLMLRLPGVVPAGVRVQDPVSLRDLAATVVTLVPLPGGENYPGVSLSRKWTHPGSSSSPHFSAVERGVRSDSTLPFTKGDMVSMFDDTWHYIRNNGTTQEELYRYREDPDETVDHALRVETDSVKARLRSRIADVLRSRGTPVPFTAP